MPQPVETQRLILAWREGDLDSRDHLISRILPELEEIAAARLRREHSSSLSSHDLVNEALVRIMDGTPEINSRAHVLALLSRLMRNVLVDQARARRSDKRRHHRVELRTMIEDAASTIDLLSLDTALIRLQAVDPDYAEIVEMRYFGGMTVTDVSEVTGWSEPTVKRRWQAARAWLADAISNPLVDD